MGSLPGKMIGVFLAFLLLAFAPIIIVILSQNIRVERTTWNYLTDYTDNVSDKGVLTANDYNEFIAKLGATTVDYEVILSVQHKLVLPDAGGQYIVKYVTSGLWKSSAGGLTGDFFMEAGDNLQVILKPLSATQADNVMRSVLNLHISRSQISYAANVRNDGR